MIHHNIKVGKRGLITIPKALRKSLRLEPGSIDALYVVGEGKLLLSKIEDETSRASCRFELARGRADISCSTEDLMSILHD